MTSFPDAVTRQQVLDAFGLLGIDLTDVEHVSFGPHDISITRAYRNEAGEVVPDYPTSNRAGLLTQSFRVHITDVPTPFDPDIDLLYRQGRGMGMW